MQHELIVLKRNMYVLIEYLDFQNISKIIFLAQRYMYYEFFQLLFEYFLIEEIYYLLYD
jgi:hypothetical protein